MDVRHSDGNFESQRGCLKNIAGQKLSQRSSHHSLLLEDSNTRKVMIPAVTKVSFYSSAPQRPQKALLLKYLGIVGVVHSKQNPKNPSKTWSLAIKNHILGGCFTVTELVFPSV